MNSTLTEATTQARNEYIALKEFTENASHEMQTPLAVIQSKLDILIQDEDLTEKQSQTLQSTYKAIQKLSKLNQSLLLLAKIENRQYDKIESINLKSKLNEKTEEFKELWQSQNVALSIHLEDVFVDMNTELADILLNNLLSNATRHNYYGGKINIELNNSQLLISNTGKTICLDKGLLFTRFYKPNESNEYNGLGLSIIKQICEASGLAVNYYFTDQLHHFQIKLNQKKSKHNIPSEQ
jgi:signal transduction histidine kinase